MLSLCFFGLLVIYSQCHAGKIFYVFPFSSLAQSSASGNVYMRMTKYRFFCVNWWLTFWSC